MGSDLFVVAYDGKDEAVVTCAVDRAKKEGARLLIAYVLEWSPYSFLTAEELAQRHKQRELDLKQANESILAPILAKVRASGADAEVEARFGGIVDTIIDIATEKGAALIFTGRSSSLSQRVFGSVASGLAQSAPMPVVIVPVPPDP